MRGVWEGHKDKSRVDASDRWCCTDIPPFNVTQSVQHAVQYLTADAYIYIYITDKTSPKGNLKSETKLHPLAEQPEDGVLAARSRIAPQSHQDHYSPTNLCETELSTHSPFQGSAQRICSIPTPTRARGHAPPRYEKAIKMVHAIPGTDLEA